VTVFKEVSLEKFHEIFNTLRDFIELSELKKISRLRSLDEDMKRVIKLFRENSTIISSIGNTVIYVMPVYYYNPYPVSGMVLIAYLVAERGPPEKIVKVGFSFSEALRVSSREKAEKIVEERFSILVKLLEKALLSENPVADKLINLVDCRVEVGIINFLHRIYGDDILNDTETISGLHSVCSGENSFFANDKVIVIPSIGLYVVRDIHRNKVFRYNLLKPEFYEVSPEEKIFYDALFKGFRDLLEPEAVAESYWGYEYAFSSSKTTVDGKRVSLVTISGYDSEKKKPDYFRDILAISCSESKEDRCTVYSFKNKSVLDNITEIKKYVLEDLKEAFLGYILRNEKILRKARGEMAKELAKEREWEVLPA
jgi:hypothetical protein